MRMEDQEGKEPRTAQTGAEVQKELERQLREFGVSVSDAFQHGFEGRGQELGDRAYGVGRAVVDAINFGLSEAGRALDKNQTQRKPQSEGSAGTAYDYSAEYSGAKQPGARSAQSAKMPRWARTVLDPGQSRGPEVEIRASARKRFGAGLTMCIVGGLMAFGFFIGGIACLASTDLFLSGSVEEAVLSVTGIGLMICGGLFTWMAAEGGDRLEASGDLKRYADAFQALDVSQGVPLDTLAGLLQQKKRKLRKTLRKLIHKGWLTAWLDEETDSLYLSAEDYRAARNIPTAPPEEEPAPEASAEGEEVPLTLETARRFVRVLEEERKIMQDPQAAEELERMHEVTQSICDWLEDHPESLPKIRRFADYYIPTTLKLLHTYNDVQGQRGESAENIRRDIAGILHTLNTAYDNLYDKLLSDVALDVSSEIAALEGMLARDGLTGEGLL